MPMKVITSATLKGGEGKSSVAILLANFLAFLGFRVLGVDMDPQRSMTKWYKVYGSKESIVDALQRRLLKENIIVNAADSGVDLLPGDRCLYMQRTMPFNTLEKALALIKEDYDFAVVDTAGTWDNITINGLRAADLVIAPAILKSTLSIDANADWRFLINEEVPEVVDKYVVLYNRFIGGKEADQYIEKYEAIHPNFFTSRLPQTKQIRDAIDYREAVKNVSKFDILYPFLASMSCEIFDFLGVEIPESIASFRVPEEVI